MVLKQNNNQNKNLALKYCIQGIHIGEKDTQKAFECFNKAIKIAPNYAPAYHNRGYLKYAQHDYENALDDFNKALNINENFITSRYWRACTNRILKNYYTALKDFEICIEQEPNNYTNFWSRGRVKIDMGLYKEALNDYNKAIKIASEPNTIIFNDRAVAYDSLGYHKEAIADYKKCLKSNPNDYMVCNNMGISYSKLENSHKAIEYYNKSICINQNFYQAYSNRGIEYIKTNQANLAVKDFNTCIKLKANDCFVYINRAQAYMDLKKYNEALKDLSYAEEINPDISLIYSLKAEIFENQNKTKEQKYNLKLYMQNQLKRCNTKNKEKICLNIYRKIEKNTIQSLKENYLWFSNPEDFNDILESCYYKISTTNCITHQVLDDIRIRSFTNAQNDTNQLLWAHYADKYKGLMIEYEIDIKEINQMNIFLGKVEYKNTLRPQNTHFDDIDKGMSYFIKHKDWNYEKEWRMITLKDNLSDGNKLFRGFKIKSITFGLNCNPTDKKKVAKLLPHCEFYNLTRNTESIDSYFVIKKEKYHF